MAMDGDWQQFESVVENLEKSFSGSGTVTRNERIMGKISGRKRQIDVCVRVKLAGEDIFFAVECKNWSRKVDVKGVESFIGLKRDVGAHLGIMVSSRGFTKSAYRLADALGIKLYRYEDTKRDGWFNGIETIMVVEAWELTPTMLYLKRSDGTIEFLDSDRDLDFFDGSDQFLGTAATLVRKVWEKYGPTEMKEELWSCEVPCSSPDANDIRSIGIGARPRLIRGYRNGRLQYEGLVDDSSGKAKVSGWKMLFFEPFNEMKPKESPKQVETLSLLLRTTHVRTLDVKTESVFENLLNGYFELQTELKSVTDLCVRFV